MAQRRLSARRLICTFTLAFLFCLISATYFFGTAIAAEQWPCTESYDIGGNLPSNCEPSDLAWSKALNSLFLVSDNGDLFQMDREGNISHNWSPGGDLEGVAVVERRNSYVYLGIEHPDSIREFNLDTGSLTGHSWDLTPWMTGPDNQGLEALTFVPNGYHPYNYSASGGLFYAGLQADGKIYVFDVDLSASGSVSHVATLTPKPGVTDISGLHFCRETNILYGIYDTANLLVEMRTDGTVLREYNLPNNDQEAFTIIPSETGHGEAFIGEDTGTVWRWEPYPTTFTNIDTSPPTSTVKLVFIHHSCGSNWLANGNGNLGTNLNSNNYYVTETYYEWDAEPGDDLGDHTDTTDWPLWFNETKMPYVYSNNSHYAYTNTISDPGGENEIIMFKSCFPNSEVGDSIDDEKAIYNSLLPYFEAHTNKLFILITPPGEEVVSSYVKTKELCDWLVDQENGWLASYTGNNVKVFDFYGVLSEVGSHHRVISGDIEHTYDPSYDGISPYHDGDDHPNATGNQKATAEFILLLNVYYNQWSESSASPPTVETNAASSITQNSATLNGNITDIGGASCDQRGFDYRKQGETTWSETSENGSFGTGTFSLPISGLSPNTTYEFRSKAHNQAGWGYGAVLNFTTSANSEPQYPVPTITSINPSYAPRGTNVSATITGSDFLSGATVKLTKTGQTDINATGVTVVSSTKITCTLPLPSNAQVGAWNVVVTNPDSQSATLSDGFAITSPTPTPYYLYLAEGSNAWGFSTYITIENPNESECHAKITYMDPNPEAGKGRVFTRTIALPPLSQTTISSAQDIGEVDFSTKIECIEGKKIAVDRTMFWNFGSGEEGHSSVGTTTPSKTWYLPEGSSAWGFETWTLIQNPNSEDAEVTLTYMTQEGEQKSFTKKIPAYSRATYNMAVDIGEKDSSIKVSSNVPVIAERAMYRNNRREGHSSIGSTTPATDYYLAEGAVGWDVGFETWVLVQNPNDKETEVSLTFMTQSGEVPGPSFKMAPNSRESIPLHGILPKDTDVSTHVHGNNPIIAERAMYWTSSGQEVCHDSIGMDSAHSTFYLPDGWTDNGRETWTLIQNPNSTSVEVEISYLTPTGKGNVTKTETIPANSRKTFNMLSHSGIQGRAAIMVRSKTSGKKIMVERAMYWNSRGAGTDTIGGYSE